MTDLPDQKQLWDAYGHAMGAIGGVELLLRIALINKAVAELSAENDFTDESKSAALTKIQGRTLGPTVAVFKAKFPELGGDPAFCESIENAVNFRNQLAHHFIENHLLAFRSQDGIELATLECIEHTSHFQSLDQYIRDKCPVDYNEFFALGEGKEDQYVQGHPLREKLKTSKAGRLRPAQSIAEEKA